MTRRQQYHASTSSLRIVVWGAYGAMLLLFAWQTWEFVNWLFPDDELIFRILTFICFDVMALVWGLTDLTYRFTDYAARTIVRWGWIVTFILSLVASILYLVIQGFFRFHLSISVDMLNIGYGVSIVALVYNILILTAFLYREESARAKAKLAHQHYVRRKTATNPVMPAITHNAPAQLAQHTSVTQHNASNVTPMRSAAAVRQQRYRNRKRGFMP